MLETLTTEQEGLLDTVAEEYCALPLIEPDNDAIREWIDFVYREIYQIDPPAIMVVDSPAAALHRATQDCGQKQTSLDSCGVSGLSWIARLDAYFRLGVVSDEEMSEVWLFKRFAACAWDTILLDERAIVVRYPVALHRDSDGSLHNAEGPAVSWADGEKGWFFHGERVPERVITDPTSYTASEYKELSTEARRAVGEIAGWDHVVSLLGSVSVDTWTDPGTQLVYELLRSAETSEQWLRKLSPPLQDGSQPTYLEPVHEDLRTAAGARKWQATDLAPGSCDADPTLIYEIET